MKDSISQILFALGFVALLWLFTTTDFYKNENQEHLYAFGNVEQCQKYTFENNDSLVDCQQLDLWAKALAENYQWNFPDGGTCALHYGAHSCLKSEKGFSVRYMGFMYSEQANYKVSPIFYSSRVGHITPNGFPVKIGYNGFNRSKTGYLSNLSIPRSLHTRACYETGGKHSSTVCGSRTAVIQKSRSSARSYRVTNSILREYSDKVKRVDRDLAMEF